MLKRMTSCVGNNQLTLVLNSICGACEEGEGSDPPWPLSLLLRPCPAKGQRGGGGGGGGEREN